MAESLSSKLYRTAKKLNDLNSAGKVKGFSSNEKGYAKILCLQPGCTIWIHHSKNERLTIDLMVTETAARKYPFITSAAIMKFKEYAGNKLNSSVFEHAISKDDKRQKFGFDVTNDPFEKIDRHIECLLMAFSDLEREATLG